MNYLNISKIQSNLFFNFSLVANTLAKLSENRRCFIKIGNNLVEKTLPEVRKDLNVEISNIKQTLDVIYRTMTQQESIINEYEKKYNDILGPTIKKYEKISEEKEKDKNKDSDGILA